MTMRACKTAKASCGSKSKLGLWVLTVTTRRRKKVGASSLVIPPCSLPGVSRDTPYRNEATRRRASRARSGGLALALLLSANAKAFPIDKEAHFFASYGIALSVSQAAFYRVERPELVGFGVSLAVGLLKEMTDKEFSGGDLAADFLGAATGAFFHYSIRF